MVAVRAAHSGARCFDVGLSCGPMIGAFCYNILHATPLAWALLTFAYFTNNTLALALALLVYSYRD